MRRLCGWRCWRRAGAGPGSGAPRPGAPPSWRGGGGEADGEVATPRGRADIVVVKGPLVHVLECKVSMGVAVVNQAARWRGHANLVSVATAPGPRGRDVAVEVLDALGLGWYTVEHGAVREVTPPRLYRHTTGQVRRLLRPPPPTYARAGSGGGGDYTAFAATCGRVGEAGRVGV